MNTMVDYDPKVLRELFEGMQGAIEVPLYFRAMFGGLMVYADGKPLASLSNVGIGLKLSEEDREALLAIEDAAPLQYDLDSPPSKSYVRVPTEWHRAEAVEKLLPWVKRGVAFVVAQPARPKRAKKS